MKTILTSLFYCFIFIIELYLIVEIFTLFAPIIGAGAQIVVIFYVLFLSPSYKNFKLQDNQFDQFKLTDNQLVLKSSTYMVIFALSLYIIHSAIPYIFFPEIANLPRILPSPEDIPPFIAACVIAPICEEIFFRHYIPNRLESLIGNNKVWKIILVIIIASFLFAIGHMYQGIYGVVINFIRGLFLSAIYYRYNKNLAVPMIIHFLINLSVILDCYGY